jgi:hypothetical protein
MLLQSRRERHMSEQAPESGEPRLGRAQGSFDRPTGAPQTIDSALFQRPMAFILVSVCACGRVAKAAKST